MNRGKTKSFRLVLELAETWPPFVLARIKADLKKTWPEWKNRRVRGEINGFAFRTTLLNSAGGTGHVMVVYKKLQLAAGVKAGDTVELRIEPDSDETPYSMPPELTSELRHDRQLRKWFEALPAGRRKWMAEFVDQAKAAETRKARADRMVETLMLAMEGEIEPPPILRAAFERQPSAREGWDAMTPTQRRNHLLGIFHAQTVDGREKRAAAAVQECLQAAQRKLEKRK
jgi:uncharacterized protein YdeI (YjbR/CyaY-like superfamily)